jgi:hypothetical protein
MNERIKELAKQAETYADEKSGAFRGEIFMRCFTEKFAELVRQDEREACAKLCEGRFDEGLNFEGCAAVIRARGNT